jgi:multidrug efflux pump
MVIFTLAVLLVFLVLAAQYESWSLPLAIIMVVPMCILSAIIGVWVTHSDINIFTQIGFVVLVGLASKNAVLIVEFAKHKRETGMSRREATLEACRLRLRPILMTSFAFILGVVPLVWSSGAGFEMRRALGVAVFSGMLGVTFFGILLTPVFFSVIDWIGSTPAFHSHLAHKINRVLLGVLAFGYVRQFGRWSRRTVELQIRGEGQAGRGQGLGVGGQEESHPAPNGQLVHPPIIHHESIHTNGNSADHAPNSNGAATNGDTTNHKATNGETNGTITNGKPTNGDTYSTDGHHDPTPDPMLPE